MRFSHLYPVIISFLLANSSLTLAQQAVVGAIPTEMAVNNGQLNYSVPIQVAPGRGGMQPELSLNYTGSGNGVLGVGWSLGGLSSIHRCAPTLDQDGFVAGITFTDTDRYCLDGQRLIPVNGVNGGVGTEYKTEIDSYSQIKSYGGTPHHPAYFIVKTKAGQVITFGGGNASLTYPQGVSAWSVKEINDTTGNNPVSYEYFTDRNTQYIDTIHYSGGRVGFTYEANDRLDSQTGYLLANAIVSAKRLSKATIYAGNGTQQVTLREYLTEFEPQSLGEYSKLIKILLCTDTCLNTIDFNWQVDESPRFIRPIQYYPNGWNFGFGASWENITGDFNGDGLTDYARLGGTAAHLFLSNGDGTFSHPVQRYPNSWNFGNPSNWKTIIGDFNGDGLTDYARLGGTASHIFLSNGDGTFSYPIQRYPNGWNFGFGDSWENVTGDFNGDGLTDYARLGGTAAHLFLSNGDGTFSHPVQRYPNGWNFGNPSNWKTIIGDFNGDGLTDYARLGGTASHIFLSKGDGTFSHPVQRYPNGWDFGFGSEWENITGDFNGDGLTDYARLGGTAAHLFISKGDGSFSHPVQRYPNGWDFSKSSDWITISGDLNGDGLTDYARLGGTYAHLFINNGDSTFSHPIQHYPNGWNFRVPSGGWKIITGDFNGNGKLDYMYLGAEYAHTFLQDSQPSNINKITDSLGNQTNITYQSLTDSSIYIKGTNSQYPLIDTQPPQFVVSSTTSTNGIGGTTTVNYRYEGLKTHLRGRGSFGYAKITETYPETGKQVDTYYNQTDFSLAGYVDRVVESYNGQVVNESDKTYTVVGDGDVRQVYPSQSVDKSYELNGNMVTTVSTINSNIDTYGNVGQVSVTTTATNPRSGVSESFTKTTSSTYTNDTANWYLGRLTEATVTHQSPSQPNQQRRTQFAYDSATGLLRDESVVSTLTGLPLSTTHYTYDAYGQRIQTQVTAQGETPRTSTVSYDTNGWPLQRCNALNECETYTHTPEGWLASTTGPNGITTSWEYDSFGRVIKEIRADGTETTTARHFASTGLCGKLATHTYSCSITQTSGSAPSIMQYDSLGREIRRIATGFDGRLIYSDTEYNHISQVTRVSRNYFDGDPIYWANSEYDALGRVTQLDEPSVHGSRNKITNQYNGLITTVTSGSEARVKTTYSNALGQVIYRGEEEGSFVEYTYTADGNLNTTTVAGDSATIITLSYDEFGRKVGMDDPDMGQWSYSYNAFGELTSQTDAKGQTTTMAYDVLGRLISRNEPDGTSIWVYGDHTAPQGSVGKLLSESNSGITKSYFYDSLGRPEEVQTDITGETSFSTQTLYDNLGRVSRTLYPGSDNFYTENLYNVHGFLEKVRGLRSNSESYDLSLLTPLVSEAITLADSYHQQAQALQAIGASYQATITQYQALIAAGTTSGSDTALTSELNQHQSLLQQSVTTANTSPKDFYNHLNNTLIELQTVTELINEQVRNYQATVDQLLVLAEQTLAAADNSFQYERTIGRGANTYTELVNDTQYTNYWQALDVDASGRISAEVYGNGIVNDYTYNQATGQLQQIRSGLLSIDPIRHLEYQYDMYQNVTIREDHANDIRETYQYDRLDRLTRTDIVSNTYQSLEFNGSQTQSYDALGNITHKSDMGSYSYGAGGAGPHAVTQVTDGTNIKTYAYDANGNMTSGDGRTMQWSSFNKPTLITKGTSSAEFSYGADRARYKKVNHLGDTTLYVGKLYERLQKNSGTASEATEEKHYIYANGQLVAEHIVSTEHGLQTRYLHKDALGSVDLVTDATANVVDRRSFDAWGKLRNLTWKDNEGINDPLYLTQLPFTTKGYTGHEHVQEVGLIHMNGRVYDASLARFLSSDPFVQAPKMSQSYNRYAYVMSNPMKYTDPSGYLWKKLRKAVKKTFRSFRKAAKKVVRAPRDLAKKALREIAKVPVLNAIVGAAACSFGGPVGCAAFSAASTYAITGSLSASFRSGVFGFAGATVFPAKGLTKWKAISIAVSAHSPKAGAVLSFLASGSITPRTFAHHSVNYYAGKEVNRLARKNGLSGYELNVILGGISLLGNKSINTRYNRGRGGIDFIDGISKRGAVGYLFDATDLLLSYQGLPNASVNEYLSSGRQSHLVGYSAGAVDVSNIAGRGLSRASQIDIVSLPFLNASPSGTNIHLGATDPVNGGVAGLLLNPTANIENAGLADHTRYNYNTLVQNGLPN